MRRPTAILPILLLSLPLLSCKSDSEPDGPIQDRADAGAVVTVDAPASSPDAAATSPDATPPSPDARPPFPDATPPSPDATPPMPDARPSPDAPLPTPDAALPDAPLPMPDAASFDAPPATGTCLPQCFIEINAALLAPCTPSGECTTSGFNPQTFTFATCWANGVKLVNMLSGSGTTSTVKEPDGDTCYSYVGSATASTATILYKDRTGAQVAKIIVPDSSQPTVEDYYCGAQGPYRVDLSAPECAGVGPDAGGGAGCPQSASCTP